MEIFIMARLKKYHARVLSLLVIACFFLVEGCARQEARGLTISAAISLKEAFEDMGRLYRQKYGEITINYNFGASGALQKQISAGAPVDLFAPASKKFMEILEGKGRIAGGTRKDYAGNEMVLIVPKSSMVAVSIMENLASPGIKKIAIGNPETVPAGKYAEEALESLHLWRKLKPKIVFAENVRQVIDYVATGEVDAGFVYRSDLFNMDDKITVAASVPERLHSTITYTIAAVKGSKSEVAARQFIEIATSQEGSEILKKYRFRVL